MKASRRAREIKYAIRELISLAREISKETGEKIISLASGDPVKYGFFPPKEFLESLLEAINNYDINSYGYFAGEDMLREELAKFENTKINRKIYPDDLLITAGSIEAISAIFLSFFESGDKVLLPDPCYPPYTSLAKLHGLIPTFYPLKEEDEWLIDVDFLEFIIRKEKPRGLVIINPNNPTGAVFSRNLIREIIDLAGEYNILSIFDEVYDKIIFNGDFEKAANLASDIPIIVLNSLSKVFAIPGWRIGYVYKIDREEVLSNAWEGLKKVLMLRISNPRVTQIAAALALNKLNKSSYLERYIKELDERRRFTIKMLRNFNNLTFIEPLGAFYVFPRITSEKWIKKDEELVLELLKKEKVLIVHGSAFGKLGTNHVRLVFLPPKEVIEIALDKLKKVLG